MKTQHNDGNGPETYEEANLRLKCKCDDLTRDLIAEREANKRLEQQLTDLRALHIQQMEEAWDASEAYLYFTEGPGPYAPDKSTYISKITNQKHSI